MNVKITALTMGAMFAFCSLQFGQTDAISKAVSNEDWPAVAREATRTSGTKPANIRLLLAHAYLAENLNNQSVCLLATASVNDIREWDDWARAWLKQNPRLAVAHYLAGDAAARSGRLADALAQFDEALRINPHHALSLNAKGVVYSSQKRWDMALDAFDAAETAQNSLADAYANRGTLNVLSNSSARGAIRYFEKAIFCLLPSPMP